MATPVDYPRAYRFICFCSPLGVLVIALFPGTGALVFFVFLALFLLLTTGHLAQRATTQQVDCQAIAERADKQHAAALRGEAYGTYGEYQPANITYTDEVRKYVKDWTWRIDRGKRVMVVVPTKDCA